MNSRKNIFSKIIPANSELNTVGFFTKRCNLFSAIMLFMLMSINLAAVGQVGDYGIKDDDQVIQFSGANLIPGATNFITFTAGSESRTDIKNIITLSLNEETTSFLPGDFDVTLKVNIAYGDNAGATSAKETDLKISYRKAEGVKYDAKNYFYFSGAKYVKLTIVNAPVVTGSIGTLDIKTLLTLSCNMRVIRYYDQLGTGTEVQPTVFSNSLLAEELKVNWSWPSTARNTHTQLEWAWVENELSSSYPDMNSIFKNATRIDLPKGKDTFYIPLLYGAAGKIYCRIRAVNMKKEGRTDGPWSVINSVVFGGHMASELLNWQATTSYAEEGKRKSVVQYFDGSLRSRQTVTKESVNNTTIATETFYDGKGRAAVQVLPAPGMASTLAYTKGLNQFASNSLLNLPTDQGLADDPAKYFDLKPVATATNITAALKTNTGASQYYSSANPEKNILPNNYIPDAEGYPYTVTRYMPDATGRIQSQGGVGDALRMGNGHETKYFYGTPTQEDLDALFGTEAGVFTHYAKNMVRDANGQMSVSYVDMHGRTIATALAGESPGNLVALLPNAVQYPSQEPRYMTQDLLANNGNTRKNNRIESISTILVPAPALYKFSYEVAPMKLQLSSCSGGQLCYNLMYNVDITITDESGETAPIVKKYSNVNAVSGDNCADALSSMKDSNGNVSDSVGFSVNLLPGSYIVRKTLSIDEASLQRFKEMYMAEGKGLCKTEQQLTDSIYSVWQASSKCGVPPPANKCQACIDSLGLYSNYKTKYLISIGNPPLTGPLDSLIRSSYVNDSLYCNQLCGNTSQLTTSKRELMLADMMPYSGQYASKAAPASGTLVYNKYNIFTATNNGKLLYQLPLNKNKDSNFYYTNYHIIDSSVHPDGTRAWLRQLSKDDFTAMFKNSWAEALLPYHPEYNKLLVAENDLPASYNWINNFNNANTWAQATDSGYILTPTNFNDPFYLKSPGDKAGMAKMIDTNYQQGLSMWQIAYGNAKCKDIIADEPRKSCYQAAPKYPGQTPVNAPYTLLTTAEKDVAWNNFKNLYANERDNLVNKYIGGKAPLPDSLALMQENYIVRFPSTPKQQADQLNRQTGGDWSWFPATPGAPPDTSGMPSGTTAAQTYASRCGSYIEQWKRTLEQCPALAARSNKDSIIAEITNAMQQVCIKGSNAANPYGSSNVAPSTPNDGSFRIFEDVFNFVFSKYSISKDNLCTPYVIEYPKPYGKGPVIVKELTATLDTCNCNRFAQVKSEAAAAGKDPNVLSSLNQYLSDAYGDTLTTALYTAMVQNCSRLNALVCKDSVVTKTINCTDSIPSCDCSVTVCSNNTRTLTCTQRVCTVTGTSFTLSTAQPMPEFLKCGFITVSKCLNCAQLSALTKEFKDSVATPYNAGPVFTGSDLDSITIHNNILFAKFINYRTGYQYSWQDYAKAASTNGCNLANYAGNSGATQKVICADTKALTDTTGRIRIPSPCERIQLMALELAQSMYKARSEALLANFEAAYRAKCMTITDSFLVSDTVKEYHYTLYYYDLAGNLVKTIPPKGVRPIATNLLYNVKAKRALGQVYVPAHLFATEYRYNSLNQVTAQTTPDAGRSDFWYDRLGRLAVSQNAQQKLDVKYSYTLYDALGRISEVGQKPQTVAMGQGVSQDTTALKDWILNSGGIREQITKTVYDLPYGEDVTPPITILDGLVKQKNMRNRVSYTMTLPLGSDPAGYHAASFYSYDVHGNVDTLVQNYNGISEMVDSNKFKLIAYDYDLISGKVNQVSYQPGKLDAFYHRYGYDMDNRLIGVETSRDRIYWEQDAAYSYYKHGPLSRTVLGQQQVQGMDYAYTLQGWLKGMNSSNLLAACDMGRDGLSTGNSTVARDIAGYSLHYYDSLDMVNKWMDYKAISGVSAFARPGSASGFVSLYNGNIGAMSVNNAGLLKGASTSTNALPLFYNYRYDQLNRLVSMQAYKGLDAATNRWTAISIDDYKEAISYDPNGNILIYNRKGAPSLTGKQTEMDALGYNYIANSNKLSYITDAAPAANYTEDIDNQTNTNNYSYDAIGNLRGDAAEGITAINWNVYGKITSIIKNGSTISYSYDASGNRISKTVGGVTTVYVRDASGNVMSVYQGTASTLKQTEAHLYGSGRLGIQGEQTKLPTTVALDGGYGSAGVSVFTRGEKSYELSNHLGNVLATVSDRKLQHDGGSGIVDYYTADVLSATDYAPFGMQLAGRSYSANGSYRYGFNGKENDNEVKGEGNQQDYGMRMYDPRLGRWNSLDPLQKKYPGETPYLYTGDNPILFIDPDGKDRIVSYYAISKDGTSMLIGTITYKGKFGKATSGSNIFNIRTYKTDIYDNVYFDLGNNKIVEARAREVHHQEINFIEYSGIGNIFTGLFEDKHSQSKEKGSYQPAGFSMSGGDGNTLDLKDRTDHIFGHLDLGTLLGYANTLNSDISPLFESMDGSALQKILTGLEKLKATKELKENGESLIDQVEELMERKQNAKAQDKAGTSKNLKGPYVNYKRNTILHTNTGNVRVETDNTATCCQDDKNATDTLPNAKKKN